MADLRERLRLLDRLQGRDLWPDILGRVPAQHPAGPRRRLAVAALALAVIATGIGLGWAFLGRRSGPATSSSPGGGASGHASPTPPPRGALRPTPEGREGDIAYAVLRQAKRELWLMSAGGGRRHRLALGTAPAWSADGMQLAFDIPRSGGRFDVAVMRPDGTGRRAVVTGVGPDVSGLPPPPAWSPDGRSLAFATRRGIEVVGVDGGHRRVVATRKGCHELDPAWSPDGSLIAFVVACGEGQVDARDGIAVISPDGTGWRRIVGPGGFPRFPPSNPAWSPDGRYLAFDAQRGDGPAGTIYLVRPDGSDLVRFHSGIDPTWSSDGARIAFAANVEPSGPGNRIESIAVDGSGLRRLTPLSGASIVIAPAWRP